MVTTGANASIVPSFRFLFRCGRWRNTVFWVVLGLVWGVLVVVKAWHSVGVDRGGRRRMSVMRTTVAVVNRGVLEGGWEWKEEEEEEEGGIR